MKLIWILWAFLAGAVLPIQAGLNGRMSEHIRQPVVASMLSFAIGALTLMLFTLRDWPQVQWSGMAAAPAWVWLAGVVGAFYVTSVIILAPQLGAALTFSLVVLGQMGLSLFLDHFALLGMPQNSFSLWRLAGIALIIGGVAMLRMK